MKLDKKSLNKDLDVQKLVISDVEEQVFRLQDKYINSPTEFEVLEKVLDALNLLVREYERAY